MVFHRVIGTNLSAFIRQKRSYQHINRYYYFYY